MNFLVIFQFRSPLETPITESALKGFRVVMNDHVLLQMMPLFEAFFALQAWKWPLIAVLRHVIFQASD